MLKPKREALISSGTSPEPRTSMAIAVNASIWQMPMSEVQIVISHLGGYTYIFNHQDLESEMM